MGERIVFCPKETWARLGSSVGEELGHTKARDRWAKMGDSELLAALAETPDLTILYLTPEEYDQAMHDLDEGQVAEAIELARKRAKRFASFHSFGRLLKLEQNVLVLTAIAVEGGRAYPHLFDDTMWRMVRLSGNLRYTNTKIEWLLQYALNGDSELIAEARTNPPVEDAEQVAEASKRYGAVYGQILNEMGFMPAGVTHLFVDPQRVFYIHPSDPNFVAGLHASHTEHLEWRGGVITPWRLSDVRRFEVEGRSMDMIYPSSAMLVKETTGVTHAQRERNLQERATMVTQGGGLDLLELWNGRRLSQALLRRSLLERVHEDHLPYLPIIEAQVAEETHTFRKSLAAAPSWASAPAAQAAAWIVPSLQAIYEEIEFFLALATREGQDAVRNELGAYAWQVSSSLEQLGAR